MQRTGWEELGFHSHAEIMRRQWRKDLEYYQRSMQARTPPCYQADVRYRKRRWALAVIKHLFFCRRITPHIVGHTIDAERFSYDS